MLSTPVALSFGTAAFRRCQCLWSSGIYHSNAYHAAVNLISTNNGLMFSNLHHSKVLRSRLFAIGTLARLIRFDTYIVLVVDNHYGRFVREAIGIQTTWKSLPISTCRQATKHRPEEAMTAILLRGRHYSNEDNRRCLRSNRQFQESNRPRASFDSYPTQPRHPTVIC